MLELRGEPDFVAPSSARADRRAKRRTPLESLVRSQILPRLLHVHARADRFGPSVETLARALIGADETPARAALARVAAECGDDARLLLEVLAPAARQLGLWWREDVCDFVEVGHAMARLHAILAGLAAFDSWESNAPAMLLLTVPGETHRFGADMAADLFRREGWRVVRADGDLAALANEAFDAVGVSCGSDRSAAALPAFLTKIKGLAGSRAPPLLLGGALFEGHPGRAESFNADFVASDPEAPRRISRALLQPRRGKPKGTDSAVRE